MTDPATETTLVPLTARQRLARGLLLRVLGSLTGGRVVLRDHDGDWTLGRISDDGRLAVTVVVTDGAFYPAALLEQSAGVGRAFMAGWWTCDDPVALIRILARNEVALRRWTRPTLGLLAPWHRLALWLRRNDLDGARRNIAAHYDQGNEFFAAFLDPSLTYSSAVFEAPDQDLAEAQRSKLDRICRKLDLSPRDHVLEIGTGWGSFAIHAAERYGCRVTTTTLSAEQADHARELVARRGLADRITVLEQDYRELEGQFDKLVSVEMIEAVGTRYYGEYFRRCSDLLAPDGAMVLQAIVVDDRHFAHDAHHRDFIKRYIFPGGVLPSIAVIARHVARQTDLQTAHLEDLTAHYAETLARWRAALRDGWDRLRTAGRSEEFLRAWEFYFVYCEGGFRERRVGVVQQTLVKPRCRSLPMVSPVTTAWPEPEAVGKES
ncbi:methyltransferase domain-containing protein [bacterium]|nr:methyltransferase domain-containing protein [bacterium]